MSLEPPRTTAATVGSGVPPDTTVLQSQLTQATSWFFWVAGLSFANGLISTFGGSFGFLFGLGLTQFVDALTTGILRGAGSDSVVTLRFVNLGVDALIAGLLVMCGVFGRERRIGVYVGGLVFYALDAVLSLVFQDWLGGAFHAWVLWRLWGGLQALRELRALEDPRVSGQAIS